MVKSGQNVGVEVRSLVGRRVRELREAAGMTVAELGKASAQSRHFVDQVESGRTSPTVDTLARFADAIGVALTSLVDFGKSKSKAETPTNGTHPSSAAKEKTPAVVKAKSGSIPKEITDQVEAAGLSADSNCGRILAHLYRYVGSFVDAKDLHQHIHTKPAKSTIQSNVASYVCGLVRNKGFQIETQRDEAGPRYKLVEFKRKPKR